MSAFLSLHATEERWARPTASGGTHVAKGNKSRGRTVRSGSQPVGFVTVQPGGKLCKAVAAVC